MAEALGVASSVIAVVDLSAKVIKWCVRYAQDVSHAKEDKKRLVDEVTRLNLASVNARELLYGPHGSRLKASHALYMATVNSQSQLKRIESQLAERGGQGNISFEALKWPFKSKDLQTVIYDLHRCTRAIYSALEVDQTSILLDIDHKIALDMLPIAEGASFDSHAEEHNPICLPNTREELLKEIDRWIDDPNSKTVYWLNGMAGTGKSTISRTVARARSKRGDLGASFFFKRGEMDRDNLNKLISTFAHQLALSIPGAACFIKKTLDANPAIMGKTVKEQFKKLIQEPLSEAAATPINPSSVVMVIDALDECDQEADIRLLINIFSQAKTLHPHLRVFLTSRPELPVRLGFSEVQGSYQDLVLHNIPAQVVEHDIIVFLDHEFKKIRHDFNMTVGDERKLPPDWPGRPTVKSLAQMAVPLFIFAATVCRFVGDSRRRNPRTRLETVLNHGNRSYGPRLEQTYTSILRSQVTELPRDEREEIIKDFKVVVGSIIMLASPLSVTALSRLIDTPPEAVDERLDVLHSVLSIPLERTMPVRLLHLSFRDYLINPENEESVEFWVDEKLAHRRLAKHCLRIMRGALRKNICSLSFPGMHRSAVSVEQLEEHVPPELQYACMNWVHHQTKVDFEPNESNDMYDFLKTHFLHWLEALSIMGRISESIRFIDELQSIVDAEESAQVLSFLRDAKRFVLNYRWIIDTAPLQLYASAIVFAPNQSIMRQTFKHYLPGWISLLPKVDSNWDAVLQTLEGHTNWVSSVVFSNDGTLIASGSHDKTVKIWNIATGKEEQTLKGHTNSVSSVVFSNNGKLIASGSYDNTVKIWNIATGKEEQTLKGHINWVSSVVFSNDSKLIASGSYDKTIKVWNVATGKEEQTLEGHINWVSSVVFSNDSKLIASGSGDRTVKIWNMATGEEERTLEGHAGSVTSVMFSNNSKLIASGSYDETVKIWNVATGEEERTLEGHTSLVTSVVFSKDSKLVISGSFDMTVKIWNAATGEEEQTLEGHTSLVTSVVFSKDSKLIASGSEDKTVKIWIVVAGEEERILEGHAGSVTSVVFSNDGKLIASGSGDETIKIWNAATGEEEQTLEGHISLVTSVVFSKDSKLIASGSEDKTVKIWIVVAGEEEQTLKGHAGSVTSVMFSNNSKLIASGSYDKTVKIWNVAMGKEEQTLKGHTKSVSSVVFSNNSKLIASGSFDKTVKIWNVATGKEERTLEGHTKPVNSVVFSKDGTLIASGSDDETVKIWNVAMGINVKSFDTSRFTNVLSFTDDNSVLVTSTGRFSLDFLDISTSHLSENEPKLGSTEVQGELDARLGFGINHDNTWITAGGPDGRKVLWLPPDFRPRVSATLTEPLRSVIAIGFMSGRVVIMGFRESSFSNEV
ncbi:hypothetical protein ACKAV7_007054 [Fusarium commune]